MTWEVLVGIGRSKKNPNGFNNLEDVEIGEEICR